MPMTDHDELLARFLDKMAGDRRLDHNEQRFTRQAAAALRAALAAQPQPLFEGTPVELRRWLRGSYPSTEVNTATSLAVYPAVAGSAPPTTEECVAKGCDDDAITEFTDGAGRILWLCEDHGDELAVGFPLKDAADQITCPRCGGAGFIHIYEAPAGSATPTGDGAGE